MARKITIAAILISVVLVLGFFVSLKVAFGNSSTPVSSTSLKVQTIYASAPSVQILNSSVAATTGEPFTLAFRVSSPVQGKFYVGVTTNGTNLSTGLISIGRIPVPVGMTAQYPNGNTFSAASGTFRVTISLSSSISTSLTKTGQLPLEVVVFQQQGTDPGQAAGVSQSFTIGVTT